METIKFKYNDYISCVRVCSVSSVASKVRVPYYIAIWGLPGSAIFLNIIS
jgi:hypothetical protein